jgi:hypothetical protein
VRRGSTQQRSRPVHCQRRAYDERNPAHSGAGSRQQLTATMYTRASGLPEAVPSRRPAASPPLPSMRSSSDALRLGSRLWSRVNRLVACSGEFVSLTQPLPLVTAQYRTGFAEPRPQGAVLTSGLRQAPSLQVPDGTPRAAI